MRVGVALVGEDPVHDAEFGVTWGVVQALSFGRLDMLGGHAAVPSIMAAPHFLEERIQSTACSRERRELTLEWRYR